MSDDSPTRPGHDTGAGAVAPRPGGALPGRAHRRPARGASPGEALPQPDRPDPELRPPEGAQRVGVLAVTLVLGAVVGALYARITERRPADPGHPLGRLGLSRRGLSVLAAVVAVGRIVSIAVFWPLLASYYRGAPRGTARQCRLAALRLRRFRRHPDRRLRAAHQQAGGRGGAQRGDAARRTPGRPGRRCRPRAGRGDGRSPPQLHTRSTFGYDGLQNKGDLAAITPNDRFYVVTQNLIDPQVHKGSWQLEIGGAVDRPRQYDLGAGFPWSVVHGRAG